MRPRGQPSVASRSGLGTRLDLVRPVPVEPLAFGFRVRFAGFGSSVGAAFATALSSTVGPDELAGSGSGAGRGLSHTGVNSVGSYSSSRKIAAGKRTGGGPNVAPSSAIASPST